MCLTVGFVLLIVDTFVVLQAPCIEFLSILQNELQFYGLVSLLLMLWGFRSFSYSFVYGKLADARHAFFACTRAPGGENIITETQFTIVCCVCEICLCLSVTPGCAQGGKTHLTHLTKARKAEHLCRNAWHAELSLSPAFSSRGNCQPHGCRRVSMFRPASLPHTRQG